MFLAPQANVLIPTFFQLTGLFYVCVWGDWFWGAFETVVFPKPPLRKHSPAEYDLLPMHVLAARKGEFSPNLIRG